MIWLRVPLQIKIYDHEIHFSNMGGLPEQWTTKNLFETHASIPPNPDIAHAFYLAGYIESWGQGINRICSACAAKGIPKPEFVVNTNDILVTLKVNLKKKQTEQSGGKSGGKTL